jgi:hypothetical protein
VTRIARLAAWVIVVLLVVTLVATTIAEGFAS